MTSCGRIQDTRLVSRRQDSFSTSDRRPTEMVSMCPIRDPRREEQVDEVPRKCKDDDSGDEAQARNDVWRDASGQQQSHGYKGGMSSLVAQLPQDSSRGQAPFWGRGSTNYKNGEGVKPVLIHESILNAELNVVHSTRSLSTEEDRLVVDGDVSPSPSRVDRDERNRADSPVYRHTGIERNYTSTADDESWRWTSYGSTLGPHRPSKPRGRG